MNRRSLSQNFLNDRRTIHHLVRVAAPAPTGLVVEVGAGDGRVTAVLAARAGRVVAHELDPALAVRLRERFRGHPNVRTVQGDFLRSRPPREPFAVVGNIPYASTSAIVRWCLAARSMTSATLITQAEYARKRTGAYGRWTKVTVESWPLFSWRTAGRVSRHLFTPVPRVDSAILRLDRRAAPLLPASGMAAYLRLVALGFTGRGGSLHASLRELHPRPALDLAFRRAGVPRNALVAHVHPDQWITLHRSLHG
ncbi:ErmE/ErmH/ErmO/ErmR family 23S rRNA (adenine(2058)-N(6))-methyltransferase [Bailinhaonella thermotolerans]|uniref:ErmE/ErmH/ErmO/ErmR family 23S rRNA (Adenine(2058)-N(6))-methyltransferase n=1 Tax=Bailinhaonella thermotolerans TaxID=1070861 RepID=A0A3A4BPL2_9ACTN|nr:ErmE/ErmH/ErmO/ErmR family 23S rRNA (adenine(2058)-N(6))-methyltransferase [Bailinhaonella thermotolerans]RJL33086.1 ErmE/ErmH/ErmO/ErmR family 23S rRNA (adenine(2058)-N(6))-methyltransferase [Bailinhaonella thermotolerans]